MQLKFLCIILFTLTGRLAWSQLYFPIEHYYHGEIERYNLRDSLEHDFYRQHLSAKPILQSRTWADSIFADNGKYYYWLTQKLFKENFLLFEGDDFWCAVDPIVDLEPGHDFAIDSAHYKLWNTRGFRVQAKFMDKIGFTTSFYENQAFVPDYQYAFAKAHGEFFPNGLVTYYTQQNAVIPGYARTKTFKSTGYDFAFAEGHVSIEPNRFFNLQFGNGNQFIGNGYRSLLLSDFSVNYPFLKPEINLFNGRVQYFVTYALLQNLYRLPYHTTPEATYERKIGTFHYLDIAVTKNLTVGIFEGATWKRTDSLGTHQPNWLFTNPVILSNSILHDQDDSTYNSILGLNLGFNFFKNTLYAQAVVDHGALSAWQLGIKAYDVMLPKLDLQAEYNHAEPNTYLAGEKRYNYSHYNLPLAHPYTAGFDELLFRVNYQYGRWFAENKTIYSARYVTDTLNLGTSVLAEMSALDAENYTRTKVLYNQFEVGYRFNKRYNLQAVAGFIYRTDNMPVSENVTQYVYFGIRTRLKNKTLDF
jgi:hypothetical protein